VPNLVRGGAGKAHAHESTNWYGRAVETDRGMRVLVCGGDQVEITS
jgi:hypothetical protein